MPPADVIYNFTEAIRDRDNIGSSNKDEDINDQQNYLSGINRPDQRQTFTTGAHPGGYLIRATRVRHVGNVLSADNLLAPTPRLAGSANGTGRWLRFTFDTPAPLNPKTEYGFDLTADSQTLFVELLGLRDDTPAGDPFPGGRA